jgi:hypothetical protein
MDNAGNMVLMNSLDQAQSSDWVKQSDIGTTEASAVSQRLKE